MSPLIEAVFVQPPSRDLKQFRYYSSHYNIGHTDDWGLQTPSDVSNMTQVITMSAVVPLVVEFPRYNRNLIVYSHELSVTASGVD